MLAVLKRDRVKSFFRICFMPALYLIEREQAHFKDFIGMHHGFIRVGCCEQASAENDRRQRSYRGPWRASESA